MHTTDEVRHQIAALSAATWALGALNAALDIGLLTHVTRRN